MGEVFRARDTRLGRDVAIKVLPAELAADPERLRRFEQEARAASALNHPNIVVVHDVGTHEGAPFLVEELLEGETVRERLQTGPVPPRRTVEFAVQVCSGLAAAHEKGILHRDLKPENLFITSDGHVKILDFGVAKLKAAPSEPTVAPTVLDTTTPGVVIGTVAYMSPEQVRGQAVDQRSDIFSLGCVLYEMLSGRRAFAAQTRADTISAVLWSDPPPLPRVRPEQTVPAPLEQIVARCLEKTAGDRFSSAHDLAIALEACSRFQPPPAGELPDRARHSFGRRILLGGGVAAAFIVAILAGWKLVLEARAGRPGSSPDRRTRIVVLPFENLGPPEDAYFASGMAEEITNRLANVRGLGVISRTTATEYDRRGKTVSEIGSDLGVDYVLEGTVRWERSAGRESRVRVSPQLIRVADDTHVWAARFDRVLADVFAVQSEVAESTVTAMGVTLFPRERAALKEISTNDLEAYDLYLRGRKLETNSLGRSDVEAALEMYQRAVDRDPRFAQAQARLARQHLQMYWLHHDRSDARVRKAREAAERAVELRPDLAEPHVALGFYFYQGVLDYPRALTAFAAALEIQPDNGDALFGTACVVRRQGKWMESAELLARAVKGDPNNAPLLANLAQSYSLARRFAEADRTYDRAIDRNPIWHQLYLQKAALLVRWRGDIDGARGVLDAGSRTAGLSDEHRKELRDTATWLGAEARRDFAALLELLRTAGGEATYNQFHYTPTALNRAMVELFAGYFDGGRLSFEVARAQLEQKIHEHPGDERFHGALGIAYAGLGRRDEAVREARHGCELMPPSKDAWKALSRLDDLATVYLMTGRTDEAIATLDELLARSGAYTTHDLRQSAVWDSLRSDQRFQAMLAKHEAID